MTNEEARDKAFDIHSWLQDAVGEMAHDIEIDDLEFSYGKKWSNKAKRYKKTCGDWKGALADDFYNDKDVLSDLVGDKLYDAGKTESERIAVAKELMDISHTALINACEGFIERRKS